VLNAWTNQRLHGGQGNEAYAPIDTLPLFVKAGSIVPVGSEVDGTQRVQTVVSVRIYPGADGSFTLFHDGGTTYVYEKDGGLVMKLRWMTEPNG